MWPPASYHGDSRRKRDCARDRKPRPDRARVSMGWDYAGTAIISCKSNHLDMKINVKENETC